MIKRKELIRKYLDFFKSKDHKEIPNASLIPENDPTVLFTTAGMHPIVPYLLGQHHPLGKRICSVQKCIRTGDIEKVGDETHHTFFEMLGNWSLGDYFKKEAIEFSFEFLTKILKIPKENLSVTCFKGNKKIPKDEEAAKIWKSLGIRKIKFLGKENNWWGPAGTTGPCGPDTEMFVNGVEIWNDVFMQYNRTSDGKYTPLSQKNVDTGMGVERTIAILNNVNDNYQTDCFLPIIEEIEHLTGKKYSAHKKVMRIIADHIKASIFILAEGILPSNTEQGYVLRRLIRRAVRNLQILGIKESIHTLIASVGGKVIEIYDDYPELKKNKKIILGGLEEESKRFEQTLKKGVKKFKKFSSNKKISGREAFLLYQSYGFPLEMIEEEAKKSKIKFDRREFQKEFQKHQKLSRTATAGKFKSGLADQSEKTMRLHTATHLLLRALQIVLKDPNIIQKGSNITPERLRLDFNFPRKLTKDELRKIEDLVNAQIQNSCEVIRTEMPLEEARKRGACGIFDKKYGERVSVYSIGNFSKEICAGPHVKNTCEIGHFKIIKEESSSAGVRRIKAVVN